MNQDLETYGVKTENSSLTGSKGSILMAKILSYFAVIITLVAFILSCIGLNNSSQSKLEKTLYNFAFPYFNQVPAIEPGIVVSLDTDGYAFTGAGTTVSREVTKVEIDATGRDDIRTCSYNKNLIFTASTGELRAFEISEDDIDLGTAVWNLPSVNGQKRIVETMIRTRSDTILIIGHGQILPAGVDVVEKEGGKKMDITVTFGSPVTISDYADKSYLKCDDLFGGEQHGELIACSWEEADHYVYTNIIRINGHGADVRFDFNKEHNKQVGPLRRYYGLAGLFGEGYIVASTGALWNDTEHDLGPIMLTPIFVDHGEVRVMNTTTLGWEMSDGFFTFDNMGMNNAILCYVRAASTGITCTTVSHDMGSHRIVSGSTVEVSKGGAASSSTYSRIKMQMITRDTFGILWADANVGGAIVMQMVTMDDNEDLVKNGPLWVISQRGRGPHKIAKHIIGLTFVDWYKAAIVELVKEEETTTATAHLHTVYIYPRPIGIAGKSFTGGNEIQFGGVYKNSKGNYTIGSMYYTNDRGMILRGPPAGYAHRDFGVFYVESRSDNSLLALGNQVGIAVSKTEILLKFR